MSWSRGLLDVYNRQALVDEWRDSRGKKIIVDKSNYGGTMRLGAQKCNIHKNTLAYRMYQKSSIDERHRHRYEVNTNFVKYFRNSDLIFSGKSAKEGLMEIIEIKNHPWYLGCQFHPEFTSSPLRGHPLFNGFIEASFRGKI